MEKYSMIVSWSNNDNCYIVSVPDLPGCMADGETPQKAVENAQVIIAEWFETAQMLGREIPKGSFTNKTTDIRNICQSFLFFCHSLFLDLVKTLSYFPLSRNNRTLPFSTSNTSSHSISISSHPFLKAHSRKLRPLIFEEFSNFLPTFPHTLPVL